ncbi:MAG: NADP-reducing hydrogenase subunit HndA [Candidatus Omnitrophica bacterium ADurb.Bin205]|nr:MAG: NADP-reducing hydrogenase subunit HndA [Candidatus Omnitrophica bacterium ADurb.Bin205]
MNNLNTKKLDQIIKAYKGKPGELLGVMGEAQKASMRNYLSQDTLFYIASKLQLPASQIYSVATFYTFFNLKPQGDHCIIVCRGTACHTRGSKNLLRSIALTLGLKEEDLRENEKVFVTTKDNKFTVKTVACFGQCALAPVIDIDGKIYSHMTEAKIRRLIRQAGKKKV